MVKILVRSPTGSKIFRIGFSDNIIDFKKEVAESFHLDLAHVQLYIDHNLTKQVPEMKNNKPVTILGAKIPDVNKFPVVYIKYTGKLPEGETCTLTSYSNAADEFVGKDDLNSTEIRNFQAMWGKRAVGANFLDIRRRNLPIIYVQPESSCYRIRVGEESIKRFNSIALKEGFSTHRTTFLFGRINKITGNVTVHCSCEPQQTNYTDHVEISPDFNIKIPMLIADCFGMECVGIVYSHFAEEFYPMTPYMVQLSAHYQNFCGEYFTTLVVIPSPNDETGLHVEPFQVSDPAMKLEQENLFAHSDDPHDVCLTEDILNTFENKKGNKWDVNFFLTPTRIKSTESKFPSHIFPNPSEYPSPIDFITYMKKKESFPTWLQLFDFNLLVFLVSNNVISENDIPDVVDSIIKMDDISPKIMASINNYIRVNEK